MHLILRWFQIEWIWRNISPMTITFILKCKMNVLYSIFFYYIVLYSILYSIVLYSIFVYSNNTNIVPTLGSSCSVSFTTYILQLLSMELEIVVLQTRIGHVEMFYKCISVMISSPKISNWGRYQVPLLKNKQFKSAKKSCQLACSWVFVRTYVNLTAPLFIP